MAQENYTRYQQNVIKRFYDNRDAIAFQRAQELVTELYLNEGKKREKVWDSLCKNLERLGVRPIKSLICENRISRTGCQLDLRKGLGCLDKPRARRT